MKKVILVAVLVVMLAVSAVSVAWAGKWIQGVLDPSDGNTYTVWFHTSQQGNILHLRDICSDWTFCPRKTTVYDTARFSEPPLCEFEDGSVQQAFLWDNSISVEGMSGTVFADYSSVWVCWDYSDPWPVP